MGHFQCITNDAESDFDFDDDDGYDDDDSEDDDSKYDSHPSSTRRTVVAAAWDWGRSDVKINQHQ